MMILKDLLYGLKYTSLMGDINTQVKGVHFDSREVSSGDVFIALRGTLTDGHKYIDDVVKKGAKCVVCEDLPENTNADVVYVKVADTSYTMAGIASNFYGNPSKDIKLVGVTGTNGKTTIATLLYKAFKCAGYEAGLLSTVNNYIGDKVVPTKHTTPDSLKINALLREMADAGCEYCFMEVSSHSVVQNRIAFLDFDGGVFTNLTHEHLDYHKTFSEYIKAKKAFFDGLKKGSFAVTNADDKNGDVVLQNTKADKYKYSIRSIADFKCRVIEHHFSGMMLEIDGEEVWTYLIGDYNASNLLAVYSAARLLGMPKEEILKIISLLHPVDGRMQTILSDDGKMGIVDYAHTPDAVKNVLESIFELRKPGQKIITVVGAGGDRDKTKRPEMAKVACSYSDRVILTSDNPRTENPEMIIEDMKAGLSNKELEKVVCITSRKEAIRTAGIFAVKGDIILVAGKGHETYQEVNGVRHHFDDREILMEIFKN